MRKIKKRILNKISLENIVKICQDLQTRHRRYSWNKKRKFGRIDEDIIENYFDNHEIRKLHIGCGHNLLNGWLNTDLYPDSYSILHLDATKKFPFANDKFDYIFSEHMIEHVLYKKGQSMLNECYRVLKNNGKIRISTPDLQFLIDLYKENKTDLQKEYIKWATDEFIQNVPSYEDTFVINNFFRDWGHLFIYDEKTLRLSLKGAGFKKIERLALNESNDKALRNLENADRMPAGFLKMETLTLVGTKVPES